MALWPFDYLEPTSPEECFALMAEHGSEAKLLAGGTALMQFLKQGLARPRALINLKRLPGLGGIEVGPEGALRLGALATHRRIEDAPLVRERWPMLAEMLQLVASPRIRNMATIGGNLCHGDANEDPPPLLLALDASVRVISRVGERLLPVDGLFTDFYETALKPGELLAEVRVPPLPPRSGAVYLKFAPKSRQDFATVGAAAFVRLADAGRCVELRLGLAGVAPTPVRARKVEAALQGQLLSEPLVREAAALVEDEIDPVGDIRGSAGYKREMAKLFLRRAVAEALRRAGAAGPGPT
ncbi:MAG: xanthine dehydrogenase family protein subunit M [Deltaproteobacteria bacterium]|nr:xanthine dehydrogenase family protein subunit M [Deltaproteobacteria bacterium]